MNNLFTEAVRFLESNLINGVFISVILLYFAKILLRNRIETDLPLKILRWSIIVYAFGAIISTLLLFIFVPSEGNAFVNRATGSYFWAYWLMLLSNTIIPLLLLNNKWGNKPGFLLLMSILMNIGWLFESFIIHISVLQHNFSKSGFNSLLPHKWELDILIKGTVVGFGSLLIGNAVKKVRKRGV